MQDDAINPSTDDPLKVELAGIPCWMINVGSSS
jgi:hypothetical protein